jgi:hypothetical protein
MDNDAPALGLHSQRIVIRDQNHDLVFLSTPSEISSGLPFGVELAVFLLKFLWTNSNTRTVRANLL